MTAAKTNPIHQRDRAKRQPCRRMEVLALLDSPMTRNAIGEALGIGYDGAADHVAVLQALNLIEPCGREHGPDGKWWRTKFRAKTGGAA